MTKPLDSAQLVYEYETLLYSLGHLAKRHGKSCNTIRRLLIEAGASIRKPGRVKGKQAEEGRLEDEEETVELIVSRMVEPAQGTPIPSELFRSIRGSAEQVEKIIQEEGWNRRAENETESLLKQLSHLMLAWMA